MAIFDHTLLKIIEPTFGFHEFLPACKDDLNPSVHFWALRPDWPHPFLTIQTQNFFDQLLIFVIMYQHQFISLSIPSAHSSNAESLLESLYQTGHTRFWSWSFLTIPRQTLFNKLLIFGNLYHYTKNKAVSSISFGEMLALKILQSEWLRAFWPIF